MKDTSYQTYLEKLMDLVLSFGIKLYSHPPVEEVVIESGKKKLLRHPLYSSYTVFEPKPGGVIETSIHLDGNLDHEIATYVLAHELGHYMQAFVLNDPRWTADFMKLYQLYTSNYEPVMTTGTQELVWDYELQAWQCAEDTLNILEIPMSNLFRKEVSRAKKSYALKTLKNKNSKKRS